MHQHGRARRRRSILPAFCAVTVLTAGSPATAQFVCTTTATDVTCNNSGTAASEANFDLTKNVTTNNSGTVTTSISTGTGNSGNATTTNRGSVGADIDTFTGTNGDAATTNYGSVGGSVNTTAAISGSAVGINYGTVGGGFVTVNESGGIANAVNYGSVGGAFQATGVFDSSTLANYGSVGSILNSAPNNGSATTINTGPVASSISTFAQNGNATTTSSGPVGTSISTTAVSGNATTTNSGSVGTNIDTITPNGGNVATTNSGAVGGNVNSTAAIGGSAVGVNSGVVGGNFIALSFGGGFASATNYGTVGGAFQVTGVFDNATAANFGSVGSISNASLNSGTAVTTNTGSVSTSITTFGFGGATTTNSGFVGTSISTGTAVNGAATTFNSGFVGTNVTSTTATGGASTVTNAGHIGGFINVTAAAGGNATATNYGFVGGDIQALGVFGISTVANYGTAGSLTVTAPTGNAIAINSGAVLGQVLVSGQVNQTLINAGTISNPGGTAISFARPSPSTLTLLPGSFIIGGINFNVGGTNSVNLQAGNLNLTLNTLAGATIAGTVPFAVLGNRIATADPTPFAMVDRDLMDFSRGVSAAIPEMATQDEAVAKALSFSVSEASVRSRFEDAFYGIPGLSSYAQDRTLLLKPTVQYRNGASVWARGFAGERDQPADGVQLHTINQYYGGMLGADMQARANPRLGIFAGAGETRSSVDFNFGASTSNLGFAGAFAQYTQGIVSFRGIVQGGHSTTNTNRNINNNIVLGGLEVAKASYGTTYFVPEADLGLNFGLGVLHGASYTLTPSVNVRYLFAAVDGYSESGSTANLTVAARNVQDVEERGQLKLSSTTILGAGKVVLGSIYGGVIGVQRAGSTTVDTILLGQAVPFVAPGKSETIGGYGGAGIEWHSGKTTLFGSIEYLQFSDSSSVIGGRGGVKVEF